MADDIQSNGAVASARAEQAAANTSPPQREPLTALPAVGPAVGDKDGLIAELMAKLATEQEINYRLTHKKEIAKRVRAVIAVRAESDCSTVFRGCITIVDFLGKPFSLMHLDTGPSESPGMPMTGALLIERWIRNAANLHGGVICDAFFRDASMPAELKIHARFNLIRHWIARAVNAFLYAEAVRVHGLERARAMSIPYLEVRRFDHLDEEAERVLLGAVDDNKEGD